MQTAKLLILGRQALLFLAFLSFFAGSALTFLGWGWFLKPFLALFLGVYVPYWTAVLLSFFGFLLFCVSLFLASIPAKMAVKMVDRKMDDFFASHEK